MGEGREGGGLVPATVPQVWTINPQDGAIPGASNLDLGEGTQFLPPPISLFSPKLISTQSTISPISDFWSQKTLESRLSEIAIWFGMGAGCSNLHPDSCLLQVTSGSGIISGLAFEFRGFSGPDNFRGRGENPGFLLSRANCPI